MALLKSGRLDDLDPNAIETHQIIARRENDLYREGKGQEIRAFISDHHECHVQEHLKQMNDESIRMDPANLSHLEALMAHIQEHRRLAGEIDEFLAKATGQPMTPRVGEGIKDQPPAGAAPPPGAQPPPAPGGPPTGIPMIPPSAVDPLQQAPPLPIDPLTGASPGGALALG